MTVTLALPKLFDDVGALMHDVGYTVPHVFGWRERDKRSGKRRIVWEPGDNGNGGTIGPARQPGRNPRSVATLFELFTVWIEAQESSTPENERAQYQATRELYDAWYLAAESASKNFRQISLAWVIDKTDRRFGATLKVVGSIEAAITAACDDVAHADTIARVTAIELGQSETFDAPNLADVPAGEMTIPITQETTVTS